MIDPNQTAMFEKARFTREGEQWVKNDPRGPEYGRFVAKDSNHVNHVSVTHSEDGYTILVSISNFPKWASSVT